MNDGLCFTNNILYAELGEPYSYQIKKITAHLSPIRRLIKMARYRQIHGSRLQIHYVWKKYATNLLGFKTLHYRQAFTTGHVLILLVMTLQSFELLSRSILQINQAKPQHQWALSYARQGWVWTPGDKLDQRQHLILERTSFLVSCKVASDIPASTHICSTSLCTVSFLPF